MAFFDQNNNYDRLLSKAVNNIHPLMIFCNLSANFYQIISYSNTVLNDSIKFTGKFDDLISEIKSSISNKDYEHLFVAKFNRQKFLERVGEGDNSPIDFQFPYFFTSKNSLYSKNEEWIDLRGIIVGQES